MAKNVCPRLRDTASGREGGFTQPRTNFVGHLCTSMPTDENTATKIWLGMIFGHFGRNYSVFGVSVSLLKMTENPENLNRNRNHSYRDPL